MATALDGITVVDLTWGLPGAIAGLVLADHGALVVKVEPPSGDPQRDEPAFAQLHRGKRSVVADLATEEGRRRVRDLAAGADVVLESWRPGTAERLGLDHASLSATNPGLVTCSITGFGPEGPLARLKGYEGVVAAKAGVMGSSIMGDAVGGRPRFAALPGASYGAAHGALQGILAALYARQQLGHGQHVATSLVQGLTAYDLYGWLGPQLPERFATQPRAGLTHASVAGMIGFTRDGGWLQFANFRPHLVAAFIDALDLTDRYRDAIDRHDAPEVIEAMVLRRLHERTVDQWMEVFLRSEDIGVEPFRTPTEALDHPQSIHNGHVVEVMDARLGKTRQLGPLVRMAATPAQPGAGAPELGADDDLVLAPKDQALLPEPTRSAAELDRGPLTGVEVVELAWFYAAPFGTALLADLGARVVKVEAATGDPHRSQSPLPEFAGVKAVGGKESIVVDYRLPEGLEVLHRLVGASDLVMRNYRQQHSAATGDDYEGLRPANPDQVYCYAAAYGADGPYTLRPAFAPTMGVAAGQRAYQLGWDRALDRSRDLTYEEGLAELERIRANYGGPTNNADAAAALAVATAMLLGLVARQRTGQGQYLETTMICSNAYVVADDFFDFEGKQPRARHDEDGVGPLYRLYPAAQGWVFLAAPMPGEWDGLCAGLTAATAGATDLAADPRFATPAERDRHASELVEVLAAVFATEAAARWEELLVPHDVACVEVNEGATAFSTFTIDDPTMVANRFGQDVEHPLFGTHRRHGPLATLSATPGVVGPGCLVGQHTDEVLHRLGYLEEELVALRAKGAIGGSTATT